MTEKQFQKELDKKWLQVFTAVAQTLEFANTDGFRMMEREDQSLFIAAKSDDLMNFFFDEDRIREFKEQVLHSDEFKHLKHSDLEAV